ncbi:nitrate ABC transporter ATP-binding protein, partial [Pseudomonas syringae pv. tagetis]
VLCSFRGRVMCVMMVDLALPRNRLEPFFRALVVEIYVLMSQDNDAGEFREGVFPATRLGMVLPQVSSKALAGLSVAFLETP